MPTVRTISETKMITVPLPTPCGIFQASYTPRGLARLAFPGRRPPPRPVSCSAPEPLDFPDPIPRWHQLTGQAVLACLAGGRIRCLPPLDLHTATPFQRKVWSALRRLGPGHTRSYAELARSIGKPGAARAVGNACGANPIPLLIPCHRVLAQQGRLGGFSAGLAWKRLLLQKEGVVTDCGD